MWLSPQSNCRGFTGKTDYHSWCGVGRSRTIFYDSIREDFNSAWPTRFSSELSSFRSRLDPRYSFLYWRPRKLQPYHHLVGFLDSGPKPHPHRIRPTSEKSTCSLSSHNDICLSRLLSIYPVPASRHLRLSNFRN